jgi:eukaryotic-like serine/threonine-protein kinase
MTAERWGRIKAIFDSALEETPETRASFVEHACGSDEGLRREVLELIHEHQVVEQTESFLNEPLAYLSYSLAAGDAIAGRYRVVRLLGRGGMGEVYEVRDQLLNEGAALKTLRADLSFDPDLVRRFQTEIQLARRITHPNVCRLYEVGVHEFADSSRPPLPFFRRRFR